ncbi:MAG TPA: hypothetical protein PKD45_07880 [Flavobacteriales bacterium]|nr:hypothetical protein [Flavobacteriales bacterium]
MAALLAPCLQLNAQEDGQQFRVLNIRDESHATRHIHSWLDLSPDGHTLAIAPTQSFPFRMYDIDEGRITREFDGGNWYGGARTSFSTKGTYLLLEQIFYVDWAPNKVRPVKFEIREAATGKLVHRLEGTYNAVLAPDEHTLYAIGPSGLRVMDLLTGEEDRVKHLDRLGYAVAVSHDGQRLAVSHKPTKTELAAMPSVRNDKDALKNLMKQGELVVVYDAATLEPLHTLDEPFDKVFRLEYSPDGSDLWILAKPNTRRGSSLNINQRYVSVADAATGGMRRTAFPSQYPYDPDFRISPDGKLFAIASKGSKFMEIHLYDRATGRMVDRFELSYRFREATPVADGEFGADGRISFVFLPDGKRILMTFGTRLVEWTYKS